MTLFPVPQVTPETGSRLEQLLGMREAARAAAKEAEDRLTAIEAGIKAEISSLHPGRPVIDIAGTPHRTGLRLRYHEGKWYVPVAPLREKHPEVWAEMARQGRGWWQLHDLGGN